MAKRSLRQVPLTEEDRAIFDRMSIPGESHYRIADEFAAIHCAAQLRSFGSVVDCVATMEKAKRSIERGRPA